MNVQQLLARIPYLPDTPLERAAVILAVAVVVAFVARMAFRHLVHRLTKSTDTDVDDRLASILQGPAFWSIIFGGVWLAEIPLDLHEKLALAVKGVIQGASELPCDLGQVAVASVASARGGDSLSDSRFLLATLAAAQAARELGGERQRHIMNALREAFPDSDGIRS